MGKSALLGQLEKNQARGDRTLLFSSGALDPGPGARRLLLSLLQKSPPPRLCARLKLGPRPTTAEAQAVLAGKSAGAARALLLEALAGNDFAVVLDPVGFLSRPSNEMLRDLERVTNTPLVLAAASPHMEDIGYATRFAWPREQRLPLGPLGDREMALLYEQGIGGWARQPANEAAFREHVLDTAAGNPGTLLGLLRLAAEDAYWAGDSLKFHLLTVDFNLGRRPEGTRGR